MKVWLSEQEVEQYLTGVKDTTRRIAFGLGLRCGLRSAEIVEAAPADVVDGPAGTMLRVREDGAKGDKYRETPVPPNLATTIRTIDDIREEPSTAPLVDVSTRTLRRWVRAHAVEVGEECDDLEGWSDLSPHDFRGTWATLLAGAEDIDPLVVCEWGGWSDLSTFLDHYRGSYSPEVQRRARDAVEWL